MKTLPFTALTICLGAAALCHPAKASVVTVDFSGTIDTVSDPNHHLTSPINIGDSYTAQLIYDTTAPGSPFGSETLYHNDTAFSFDVTIDGISFQSSADPFGQFPVQDSTYQWDELRPSIPASVNFPGAQGLIELALGGGSHSQALPSSLNLSDYSFKQMQIQFNAISSPDNLTISGPVTSLTTSFSSVPEPASMLLVPLGLALLVSRVNNVKRHLILVSILVFGSAAIASATNIPIANFSFESPVVATQHSSISGAPPSWTGTTVNGFGVFAPDPAELAPPTDGRQVGFENTGSTLSQELTATLTANTTYTLNVDFLSRIDCCDWAGGTILLETHDRTILGETTLSTLAPGAVQTATVTYTALAGNLLLGQALVVEIDSSHNGNAGSSQIDFDNVRLGATTPSGAPEPGNFSLAATGVLLLAATWAFASRQSGFTS